MKVMRYISILLCAVFLLTACEKETEGISGTMRFELLGEETMLVTLGTSFQDPGCKVIYRGQDVSADAEAIGTVDAQTVGLYSVQYVFANKDGVKTTKKRTVIVADPTVTVEIAGNYLTADGTFRLSGSTVTNFPGYKVRVSKIAPGFFEISDFLGGYYEQRAGYGAAYACKGYVQVKNDNSITLLSSSTLPWNDTLTSLTEGNYDPSTGAVSWKAGYAGMLFTIVLK
ncbi:BT_2262 family domain-containing protein [Bacteroides timonensis]|uniref:BT_2262 family domain-containing protein n=1 Tax=Bacteroides timonensis TaxID=1470345 RepID=UPI0005C45460|nr:BT_2262 family domain-containing protein [Bacteroides timonensis]